MESVISDWVQRFEQGNLAPERNLDYGFHLGDPAGIPVQSVRT